MTVSAYTQDPYNSQNQTRLGAATDKVGGAVKENTGRVVGNPSLEQRGAEQKNIAAHPPPRHQAMGAGAGNRVAGDVKEKAGYAVGNPALQHHGEHQDAVGRQQHNAGHVDPSHPTGGGFTDKASGAIKEKTGRAVGNPALQQRGERQNAAGHHHDYDNTTTGTHPTHGIGGDHHHYDDTTTGSHLPADDGSKSPSRLKGMMTQATGAVQKGVGGLFSTDAKIEGEKKKTEGRLEREQAATTTDHGRF